jgi:hypothetical protein
METCMLPFIIVRVQAASFEKFLSSLFCCAILLPSLQAEQKAATKRLNP